MIMMVTLQKGYYKNSSLYRQKQSGTLEWSLLQCSNFIKKDQLYTNVFTLPISCYTNQFAAQQKTYIEQESKYVSMY